MHKCCKSCDFVKINVGYRNVKRYSCGYAFSDNCFADLLKSSKYYFDDKFCPFFKSSLQLFDFSNNICVN